MKSDVQRADAPHRYLQIAADRIVHRSAPDAGNPLQTAASRLKARVENAAVGFRRALSQIISSVDQKNPEVIPGEPPGRHSSQNTSPDDSHVI